MDKKPVFAIDVGGVLASKQHDGEPAAYSQDAIKALAEHFDLWIVSQCGRNRALKTREWLGDWQFPIPRDKQVYIPFSERKVDTLRDIKAMYFVDDRMKHVLPAITEVKCLHTVFHLLQDMNEQQMIRDRRYRWVPDWPTLVYVLGLRMP